MDLNLLGGFQRHPSHVCNGVLENMKENCQIAAAALLHFLCSPSTQHGCWGPDFQPNCRLCLVLGSNRFLVTTPWGVMNAETETKTFRDYYWPQQV